MGRPLRVPKRTSTASGSSVSAWLSTMSENRRPETCGTTPPGAMASATWVTSSPGLHVAGQVDTRARRLLSTMEKLAPGLVASAAVITHSPSGSTARVRSIVSASVNCVDQVVWAGDDVAATLVRHVAAES